jgi:hypothetical protein
MTTTRLRIFVGVVLGMALVAVVFGLISPETIDKETDLLNYLDSHGVSYSDAESMVKLADTLCDLDARGVDTDSFLLTQFSQEDASWIKFGVFNSGYCE